jgi:RNA polymerase primary sigma factor
LPPLPKLNIPALARLESQLRFSPKEKLLADIKRAQGLALSLDDDQKYPEDYIAFRITGYRPDSDSAGPLLVEGEHLRNDLSAFVERLCDAGKVQVGDFDAEHLIEADELCNHWNMSRRTLVRMRKRGLVGLRLLAPDGKPRVMFDRATVSAFEEANQDQISRAADYSRISPEDEAQIIKRAARYKKYLGWSLNMAAERIAERFGRSHEAIRQVLKRYEARAKEASERSKAGMILDEDELAPVIFDEAQPLTNQRREAVYRAWRLGIDPNLMSVKYRRSRPALRRAIAMARAGRLTEWAQDGFFGEVPEQENDPFSVRIEARPEETANAARALSAAILNGTAGPKQRKPQPSDPLDAAPVMTGLARPIPRREIAS